MFNRQVQGRNLGPLHFVLLTLLFLQLSLPAFAQTQPQVLPAPAPKRVLLLYTYGDGLPGYQKATPAFLSVTTAGGIDINDLFFEYLDLQRNNNAEYRQKLADLLRYKYAKHQIGLIVTVHTAALNFLLDEGKGLFPDAPVYSYLIVRPELIEAKNTGRRILLRPQSQDWGGTLEIALKMFPQTRKIVFVTGTASGDRNLEYEAKRAFEPWRDKLEFQYTSDRSVEEMVQLVGSLPPRSIVIYNNVFSDKTGRTFIPREVGKMIAKAANAPVFCLWDTLMGGGVIGGSLLSFEAEGTYAANVVLDMLNGKILLTKPVTTLATSKTYMFDCQQLKRWGVNESILPERSVLLNRVPTMWEQYKGLIIVGIAVLLAQTMLVIGLLIQRHRKLAAEQLLRQKTEELDQFFDVTLDLFGIANTDGYFLRLNPAWERTLGYTLEELMAKRFLEFVHPDDLLRTQDAVSIQASQQKLTSFENRYRCKDGTYRWLEWSSAQAGNLIYAAARDVTDHKRMEEKIIKSAEEWQTTFDSVKDLVLILDREFKIVRVNAVALSFLKLPLEKVVGNYCYTLMYQKNEPVDICPFTKMMKTKRHEESELYHEKTETWFEASIDPIFDNKGEILHAIYTLKDITERKRAEAEAFQARRELLQLDRLSRMGELTASLAHELNQPLAAILSNAQAGLRFLQSDNINLDELREILHDITQDDQRAGNVIRSLRSMVKREEVERNPVILNHVLNDVVEIFRTESVFRNVRVETEFDGSLPPVLGDKVQLQQVVLNLILNAADAMSHNPPEYRRIILRTGVRDDRARVTVRDFGPGIDHVSLERIFQPFFTTKGTGLGMGLSVCRSIVEAHGGRIWVENNPDRGATFFFEIPISEKSGE